MQASIHPNSISGSMSELQFDFLDLCVFYIFTAGTTCICPNLRKYICLNYKYREPVCWVNIAAGCVVGYPEAAGIFFLKTFNEEDDGNIMRNMIESK